MTQTGSMGVISAACARHPRPSKPIMGILAPLHKAVRDAVLWRNGHQDLNTRSGDATVASTRHRRSSPPPRLRKCSAPARHGQNHSRRPPGRRPGQGRRKDEYNEAAAPRAVCESSVTWTWIQPFSGSQTRSLVSPLAKLTAYPLWRRSIFPHSGAGKSMGRWRAVYAAAHPSPAPIRSQ